MRGRLDEYMIDFHEHGLLNPKETALRTSLRIAPNSEALIVAICEAGKCKAAEGYQQA